ncbi:MAG: alpha-galactosidase [Pseudomonadota bacterium]
MIDQSGYATLHVGDTSLVLACAIGARPRILYWGARLPRTDPAHIEAMTKGQHAPGSPDVEIASSFLNETGSGMAGPSGFSAHRNGAAWATFFRVKEVRKPASDRIDLICEDRTTEIRATHFIRLDPSSAVMTVETQIDNLGETPLSIEDCAPVSLPLDPRAARLIGFTGRWAGEFQRQEIAPFQGGYVRENKTGRTSHDSFPGLLIAADDTNEQAGLCFGVHLGWSGNHRVRVDRLSDGRGFVQIAEFFLPGEMQLAPGASYRTPPLYAGVSSGGLSALSHKFHRHLTQAVMDARVHRTPRPVHYNTWEAVYFDHDQDTLFQLADKAADLGVERFILDDGWFAARRHDRAGLGDWWPSETVYPNGLTPLIDHVTHRGMSFGLWVEPEMVNPDSELYRNHPDWVLQVRGIDQVPSRGQFVLDLTRTEVCEYLFQQLHRLLSEADIRYLKWDMNRDIHHPGSGDRPVAHAQTLAVYALLDRVRAAHPNLEIEGCASGGGRADYGILRRTDRIWTSDSNDALDRQRIQRGASHFFPLAVTGAHVGPATCHITGRRLSMELRVATALFGHMGLELNLLKASEQDLSVLKAGIALHKTHRRLLHTGEFQRVEAPDHINAMGVVASDQSEALFSWCNLTGHGETLPGRFYVPGLNPERIYRTRIVWPLAVTSISRPSVLEAADLSGKGIDLPGEALSQVGLQVPLLHPETCLVYHFQSK